MCLVTQLLDVCYYLIIWDRLNISVIGHFRCLINKKAWVTWNGFYTGGGVDSR
jgi:hypothetical protein